MRPPGWLLTVVARPASTIERAIRALAETLEIGPGQGTTDIRVGL